MSLLEQLDKNIAASGGLIISCQPVPGSPLDKPEIVAAMALAAEQAGAVAVRIEGIDNLRMTRSLVSVPIIGIIKRDLDESQCALPLSRRCRCAGAGRRSYYRR